MNHMTGGRADQAVKCLAVSATTPPVTPTQLAILRMRATGMTNEAIALQTGRSTRTVKEQMTRAFTRLGVDGIVAAFRRPRLVEGAR